jgi:hypothetical protein
LQTPERVPVHWPFGANGRTHPAALGPFVANARTHPGALGSFEANGRTHPAAIGSFDANDGTHPDAFGRWLRTTRMQPDVFGRSLRVTERSPMFLAVRCEQQNASELFAPFLANEQIKLANFGCWRWTRRSSGHLLSAGGEPEFQASLRAAFTGSDGFEPAARDG